MLNCTLSSFNTSNDNRSYLSSKKELSAFNAVIETDIIDTGIGISDSRQHLLFKPFSELKYKKNFSEVVNMNIGMGLACS